jgi:hypothetical protein
MTTKMTIKEIYSQARAFGCTASFALKVARLWYPLNPTPDDIFGYLFF